MKPNQDTHGEQQTMNKPYALVMLAYLVPTFITGSV